MSWFKSTPEAEERARLLAMVDRSDGQVIELQEQNEILQAENETLKAQVSALNEQVEQVSVQSRIKDIEIRELAALCANRLKLIEAGQVAYRERDSNA